MLRTHVLVVTLITLLVTLSLVPGAIAIADPAPPPPIVGGSRVPAGAWRDVVAVLGEYGRCTGTLIAPDVVLTAGHCIDARPTEVVVSTVDYDRPGGERIKVKWSRAYPSWFESYDIGVVMLEHVAIPKPRAIAAACLANERLTAAAPLTIVGFGLTTPAGDDDNSALHQATIPVLDALCASDPSCLPAIAPKGEFTAGGRGTDSCFGDSGGPALLDTEDGPVLVGVVSRGLALPGQPCGNGGVYVRADKVVAWIQTVTKRKLTRTTCDGGPADAAGDAEEVGGCAAGPGGAGGGLVLLIGLVVVRRRRRFGCDHAVR